jgi:hypothetical protein
MERKIAICLCSLALTAAASAQHAGDLIFGSVAGQVRIVEPTYLDQYPHVRRLTYRPPTDARPADFVGDQGFDFWFLPHPEIREVREARIVAHYVTPGLVIRDAFHTYFTRGASRATFLLRGAARHKHFALHSPNVSRPRTYVFRFQLTEAFGIDGLPLTNSPVYEVHYRAMPPALDGSGGSVVFGDARPFQPQWSRGGPPPVPEPATAVFLGAALAAMALRRRR